MTRPTTSARKKPVAFLAVTVMLLPVLLVALVLWRAFSNQIEASYEKRLSTSLSVFELAVDRSIGDFRNALSRLAADNTLQVTVDLDIRPQLKRYLSAQFEVSDFEFIAVADLNGQPLFVIGHHNQIDPGCQYADDAPAEKEVGQEIVDRQQSQQRDGVGTSQPDPQLAQPTDLSQLVGTREVGAQDDY